MILLSTIILFLIVLYNQKKKALDKRCFLSFNESFCSKRNALIVSIIILILINFFIGFYFLYIIPENLSLIKSKNEILNQQIENEKLFFDPYFDRFSSIEREILMHGEHINDETLIQYSNAFISSDILKMKINSYLELMKQIRENNEKIQENNTSRKVCLLMFIFI